MTHAIPLEETTRAVVLDSHHWTDIEVGSGLTNFGDDEFDLYLAAVERHGNPQFVVSSTRMLGRGRDMKGGGSLHYLGRMRCEEGNKECSAFWQTFYAVKKERGTDLTLCP